jgi:hypothetical protein
MAGVYFFNWIFKELFISGTACTSISKKIVRAIRHRSFQDQNALWVLGVISSSI